MQVKPSSDRLSDWRRGYYCNWIMCFIQRWVCSHPGKYKSEIKSVLMQELIWPPESVMAPSPCVCSPGDRRGLSRGWQERMTPQEGASSLLIFPRPDHHFLPAAWARSCIWPRAVFPVLPLWAPAAVQIILLILLLFCLLWLCMAWGSYGKPLCVASRS